MKDKEFRFQGLDAKTEIRLALMLIIPGLATMLGVLFCGDLLFPGMPFLKSVSFASIMTIEVCLFTFKQLSNFIKEKEWVISIKDDHFHISFRSLEYGFQISDLRMVKNLGNVGFRYLTLTTKTDTIKIRVGNTGMAPFSTQKDLDELDAFMEYMKPYIKEHFNQKELRNIIDTRVIPNFGVYVVKGDKIRYSILNKMEPWQVIAFFLGISAIILVFFIKFLENVVFK